MTEKEKQNVEDYIIKKETLAVILNPKYFKDNVFENLIFLENAKIEIKELAKDGCITEINRNNIYNALAYIRYIYDEDREERISLINDIIEILNNETPDNYLYFYRIELYIRSRNFKYLTSKYSNEEIMDLVDYVNVSIMNDFNVLNAFDDTVSDEEFINEYLKKLSSSPFYLGSINSILYECPQIFKNLTSYNRNMCVLNSLNDKIYNCNKKQIKKINKRLKKLGKKA